MQSELPLEKVISGFLINGLSDFIGKEMWGGIKEYDFPGCKFLAVFQLSVSRIVESESRRIGAPARG